MEPRAELGQSDLFDLDDEVARSRSATHAAAIAAALELLRRQHPVHDELEEFEHRPHSGEVEVWEVGGAGGDAEPGCA